MASGMNQEDLLELVIAPRVIQPETLEEVPEQFLFLDGCCEVLHPGVVLKIPDEDVIRAPGTWKSIPW